MENYYNTVQTSSGQIVNGATVTVYDASSGLPATIYEPDGVTPLANPFLSGYARSEGEVEFGAVNGQYNIKIVNGTETDWIYRITLLDASGFAFGALAYENDASGVPIIDAGGYYTAVDAEGALQEIYVDLNNHIIDPTAAHAASAISIADAGGFYSSLDVEGAFQEVPFLPPAYAYFAENRNITAPNATIPVHQWTVDGVETDIDIALTPKGTGAIVAQIPDGTVTSGNKRGLYAVDLQRSRISADEVVSGDYSFGFGDGNKVTSDWSGAAGRWNDVISTSYTFAFGYAIGLSGNGSFGTGHYSQDRGLFGSRIHSSNRRVSSGDRQNRDAILGWTTTDATATILTSSTLSPNTTAPNIFILPDNHAYAITARVIGRDTTTGDIYHVIAEGTVKRATGVATTALDGTPAYTTISKSAGASTWAVTLVANTTRGSAEIQVTGEVATTIHWACKFDAIEVG